jgi:hypothetical protein
MMFSARLARPMCRFSVAARAMSATNAPDAASIMKLQADRATKNQDMMNKVKWRKNSLACICAPIKAFHGFASN